MLDKLFNRGKEQIESASTTAPEKSVEQVAQRTFKPTQKKKNTYILHLNTMTCAGMFSMCDSTPLPVIKINGVETPSAHSAFMECTHFPNPGASQMESLFQNAPEYRIIMGAKMSQTIIEYLDKTSGKPALMLFPNGHVESLIPGVDANAVVGKHLNHASRRDFIYQYGRIIEMVKIINPLIDVRNQAMRQAPQTSLDKYAEFIAELDRVQIERAKQIVATRQK